MTRSTLSKKTTLSPSSSGNRKSERVLKRTPPSPAVRAKSVKQKKITLPTPSPPLRRSERTKNLSPSLVPPASKQQPPKHKVVKQLLASKANKASEDEEHGVGTSSDVQIKRKINARTYRTVFSKPDRDCREESNKMDGSTSAGGNNGEGKIDECFKGSPLDCKEATKDGILPCEDGQAKTMRDESRLSGPVKDGILPSEDDQAKTMRDESRLSGPVKELLENNVTPGSSLPSNATNHGTSGATESVKSDCCGEETSQMLESRNSTLNTELIRTCVGHDKGEKLISCKRKGTMVDMHSDVSATLVNGDNCNLIVDAGISSLCGNATGTIEPCSKRIRQISLSDVERNQRKLVNNVDRPSSKSEGENLSTGNREGKSGDPAERPQSNNDELRKQQRSLHLLLKPEIAKLCKILYFPDNVKRMVDNCLEYIMNNRQICTEPVSILQAFQLSLCWTAASLLNYKLDRKESLTLAKQHLNFDCKIEEVNTIRGMMRKMKEDFLYHARNYNITSSPKVSESSNRVYSNTGVAPKVVVNKDISNSIKEGKLLLMQQEEEKKKLSADIEKEKADFQRRYKIEWVAIQSCSPNDGMRMENLKAFNSEYGKRIGELKRQHETRLKDLETKQLEARRKFQESWPPHALLSLASLKKLGTGVESLQTFDQEQPHNGLVADGKSFHKKVEAMTWTATGVRLSEASDTNTPVVELSNSLVELQAPLVKHSGANEMDIMSSEDEPVSKNKCHDIAENEYDSQIPKHSNSRDQCSEGAASMTVEGEGCENFTRESHNCCRQDTVTLVLLSSNGEIQDGGTSDVPGGELAIAVHKSSSSNDDQDEVPSSRQGKLDGTTLSKPVCGCSVDIKVNCFSDSVKNMASVKSRSPEEHIPSATTMSLPNCENAAEIHGADDSNGSSSADTQNSPLSDERIASLNSKSPQEHVHSVNAKCMPNCDNSTQIYEADDGNGSNTSDNVVTLNSTLNDEKIADGATVNVLDREAENLIGINPPLSTKKLSGGAVNVSVSCRELSRPCGTASPSNSSDANVITLLNQPSLEKHLDGVSPRIPVEQIPCEVPETSHEGVTVSVLDREAIVGMPDTVNRTDYPENVATLNFSSMDQISDGDSVLDGVLSSSPSRASSPRPDEQIPVIVPEASHKVAECQLTDRVAMDKGTTSDQHESVHRIMTEDTLSQETAVSRPVDLMESLEQVQPLSSVESPPNQDKELPEQVQQLPSPDQDLSNLPLAAGIEHQPTNEDALSSPIPETSSIESPPNQDTARETPNSVSTPVDIVPANQSNHISLVTEPPEQVQQLPSPDQDLSNLPLADGIEHQPTNEDALSSPIPEASIEVPNQAVEQPASNMELDSPMPGGVRTESSDARNLSTPSEIDNRPIQTATQSASRIVPPLYDDPLKNELERIRKLTEQNMKNHEDMKLQLKSDLEKELEELRRKYQIKFQEIEVEFQQTVKNLDTSRNTVLLNKVLAEAFRFKCEDLKVSGASGMQQDASSAQHLFQLSRQQNATRPSMVSGPSSCGPRAANLHSSYTTISSQNMVPPTQSTYNTSGIFSCISARLPNVNSISSPIRNFQVGGEMRAPAPHLQPYRPSTSVPAPNVCTVPHGMPSQPAPGNIQLTPATYQRDPHRRHWHVRAGVESARDSRMDANNQSGINLQDVQARMSKMASLNQSGFGTNSSMPIDPAHQSTSPDVVCISDDE